MIAIGVANPRAQGQAMIRTATALIRASRRQLWTEDGPDCKCDNRARQDYGDKPGSDFVARRWMEHGIVGFTHHLPIWASNVSAPTLSAFITKLPVPLIVRQLP